MKKPDLVVWSEEKGYYPKELPYGSNIGAPAIRIDNIDGWKREMADVANKFFDTKYDEIKIQLEELLKNVEWNEFVYNSSIGFIPIIGHIYHIYKLDDGSRLLSIISPEEWNMEFIASTKLDTNNRWIKL